LLPPLSKNAEFDKGGDKGCDKGLKVDISHKGRHTVPPDCCRDDSIPLPVLPNAKLFNALGKHLRSHHALA
jgi:hypothetical protein